MVNYEFGKREDEVLANRMINIRGIFCICATCGMIGPIMMLAFGAALASLDGDTWVSVPVIDSDSFREIEAPFVCQYSKDGMDCPSGAKENSNKTFCYNYHPDFLTHKEAIKECAKESGIVASLACIHSKEDNSIIHEFCKDESPCWLGLFRRKDSDDWCSEEEGQDIQASPSAIRQAAATRVGSADGVGVGGAVVTIIFAFAEFAIVAYLVYSGVKLKAIMSGSAATERATE